MVITNSGWTSLGGGIYSLAIGSQSPPGVAGGGWVTNVSCMVLEDRLLIAAATDDTLATAANSSTATPRWFYNGSGTLYYKPTTGTPINHEIRINGVGADDCFPLYNGGPGNPINYFNFQNLAFFGSGYAFNSTGGGGCNYINFQGCNFNNLGVGIYLYAHGQGIAITAVGLTTYTITVNGIACSYTSGALDSAQTISTALLAAINGSSQANVVWAMQEAASTPPYTLAIIGRTTPATVTLSAHLAFVQAAVPNTHVSITGSTWNYCADNIYFAGQDDNNNGEGSNLWCSVIGCKFLHTNQIPGGGGGATGFDSDGISCQNMQNALIQGNEISGMVSGCGIDLWTGGNFPATGNTVNRNYIHDLTGPSGAAIAAGGGGSNLNSYQFTYNLLVNCPGGAFNLHASQWSTTPSVVENNTAVNCAGGAYWNGGDYFTVKNNIFLDCGPYPLNMSSTIGHNVSDYNDIYPVLANVCQYNNSPCTFASWQGQGLDTHSLTTYPEFVGYTPLTLSGWSLTAGSGSATIGQNSASYGNGTANTCSGETDTELRENDPAYSYSGNNSITVDAPSAGNWWNGLIKFTGISNLSGKTITSATLYLNAVQAGSTDTITVKRCLDNWTSSATWNTYNGTNSWTTGGAMGSGTDESASTTCTLSNGGSGVIYSGGGSQLVTDIQNIINSINPNYGWVLQHTTTNDGVSRSFAGCLMTIGNGYFCPYLSVTYSIQYYYTYQVASAYCDAITENGAVLTAQSSIANVEANAGSWYWDGTYVYIHASGGSNPATNGKTYQAVNVNPASAASLKIAQASPCRNAGTNVGLTADYLGWAVPFPPSANPAIGAYESPAGGGKGGLTLGLGLSN